MPEKLGKDEREIIIRKLSDSLGDKDVIIFAYIFGSFNSEDIFHDVDIGIYISRGGQGELTMELKLERELADLIHIPVDVRILNGAPLSFVYQVIKGGKIIVDKNSSLRADFEGANSERIF